MPFLFSTLRRFVIAAIVIPVAVAGVRKLSDVVDERRGTNRGTRLLRKGADAAETIFGRRKRR